MQKVDLSFVADIIDEYVLRLEKERKVFGSDSEKLSFTIETLQDLKTTIKEFIGAANKL